MCVHNNRASLYWLLIVACYGLAHIYLLPETWGEHSISDKGFSSVLTITLLSISIALLLKSSNRAIELKYRIHLYALAYVMLIYILREADFHRLFTDEHVTRGKFYTDPTISYQQKFLGGTPLVLFFICFIGLIICHSKLILSKILQATPWAVSLLLWGTTIFLSQLADKSSLNDFYQGRVIEECLELCASGYVLLAVIQAGPFIKKLPHSKN